MAKKNKYRQEIQVSQDGVSQSVEISEEVEEATPEVVEAPKRAEAPKVEFDGWWALRNHQIPALHKKEIIKADFKGRKVPMVATIAEFDEALKKYGVKLA